MGQTLKDSFLHGVPRELGFGGLPVNALGFRACWRSSSLPDNFAPCGVEVSRKNEVSERYLAGRISLCLGELEICGKEKRADLRFKM